MLPRRLLQKSQGKSDATVGTSEPDLSEVSEDVRVTRMEEIISDVLRYGVLLSFAVVLAGTLLLFARGDAGYAGLRVRGSGAVTRATQYHASTDAARWPTTPGAVVSGVRDGRPYAVIALGLLILIATPVLRVAASVFTFLWEQDRLYAAITAYVLAVLIVSFVIGKGG